MATRIDFKYVRQHADIARVIAHFGINLHQDGSKPEQMKGLCPFHEDTKPSLKVNTDRNIFNCFACKAKGNVMDFVKDHEGTDLRAAAKTVAEICGIATSETAVSKAAQTPARSTTNRPPDKPEAPDDLAAEIEPASENKPLQFELKLSQDPELTAWLEAHGICEETTQVFDLGRASKRSKTIGDRLAIPLHSADNGLIGYCGRYLGDDKADDVPKYILPKGFRKELELFNFNRLPADHDYIVLFESYLSVMRHHAHVACVSPFGRDLSAQQLELLHGYKRFIVVFDGDEPGAAGASGVAGQLATIGWVRTVVLPSDCKPHHLAWDELRPFLLDVWRAK